MKTRNAQNLDRYFDSFFDTIESKNPEAEYKTAVQLIIEFGKYVDVMAGANPHTLHHVYEWGQVGQEDGRLFELTATPTGSSTVITYHFKPSITPNDNGVIFANKAEVMESGNDVTVNPEGPVPINGGESFRVGPFTFVPGGTATNGAFRETFMLYFSARPNLKSNKNISMHPSSLTSSGGKRDGMKIHDSLIG